MAPAGVIEPPAFRFWRPAHPPWARGQGDLYAGPMDDLVSPLARRPGEGLTGPCFYCDDLDGPFVRDHFVANSLLVKIRRQVEHDPDALARWFRLRARARVVACVRCDVAKGRLSPLEWLRICPPQGRARVRALLEELAWTPFLPGPSTSDGPGEPLGRWSPPLVLPPPGVRSLRDQAAAYLEARESDRQASN
jgi:hypothetical protein